MVALNLEFYALLSTVQIVKLKIYKPIILPVDLYGVETCFLILREEDRLRMF
jgi:hypothetical protein